MTSWLFKKHALRRLICPVADSSLQTKGTGALAYGNAFDPVSKFWLGYSLGERSLPTVQRLVHQVIQRLVPGKIPLFLTNGEPSFESALLGHFGQWGEVSPAGQT